MRDLAHNELALRGVVQSWWRGLRNLNLRNGEEIPGREPDRGELAKLRRIATAGEADLPAVALVDALAVDSFQTLWRKVAKTFEKPLDHPLAEYAAVAASTLAWLRADTGRGDTAALLGPPRDGAVFAEARFRRLIRTETAVDLLDQGRRIAAALKGAAPVGELGASLILWDQDPRIRRRWTFAYYHLRDMPADEPSASPIETGADA